MIKLLSVHAIVFLLLSTTSIAQVNQVWLAEFNGAGNSGDLSYSMTIDQSGNTYVTGETYSVAGNYDYVTIKYNSSGDTVWARYYNDPANSRDAGRAIAIDADGNVYVTGESKGLVDYDIATIKYNSAGVQQWASRYDGPANGQDGSNSIAIDTSGNVYITGYSDGDAHPVFRQDDYVTIKYNASGIAVWTMRYNGSGNFHDAAYAIAVDKNNNVYVTGGSVGAGTLYDYTTIKYDPAGTQLWVKTYNGPANYYDTAYALAVDDSGNVFVTGSSDGTSSDNEDYATIKYNSDGTQQWLARYNGAGGGDDAYKIVLDGIGNLYVTGESRNPVSPYSYDYLTIRYNAFTGDTIWTARYNGPASEIDFPTSIAADNQDNVYVTGFSSGNGSSYDYATIKYNNIGTEMWLVRFNGSGNGGDNASSIAVDTMGNIYVAGSSSGNGTVKDIVTIKYSQSPTDVLDESLVLPEEYLLSQNYPNPFNPVTSIQYAISKSQFVTLKVYDVLGNAVATLVNEEKPAGRYEVHWVAGGQPSGVYFYKFQVGSFVESKKMILLK